MGINAAIVSFTLVAGLVTILPGPDTIMVLRSAIVRGRRSALATAFGVICGLLVWATAAAIGASALLTASHLGYTALRIGGAAYLIWMGGNMLRSALRHPRSGDHGRAAGRATVAAGPHSALLRSWSRGVFTNLLNPKVGVFYVAMLPQFIPAHAPQLTFGLLLALIHAAEGLIWFTLIILCVHWARELLDQNSTKRIIDGIAGTALVGFGLRLGLTRH